MLDACTSQDDAMIGYTHIHELVCTWTLWPPRRGDDCWIFDVPIFRQVLISMLPYSDARDFNIRTLVDYMILLVDDAQSASKVIGDLFRLQFEERSTHPAWFKICSFVVAGPSHR